MRSLIFALAAILFTAFVGIPFAATDAVAHAEKISRGRLVFAYADRPAIGVLDLDTGDVTHRFEMPSPNPRLILSTEGRYVLIVTGDAAGTVRVLDTGVTSESHGDHIDIEKGEVKLLELAVTGTRPSHVVSANGWITVFYDGQRGEASTPSSAVPAKAVAVDVSSLTRTKPVVLQLDTPGPQHGLAFALGQRNFLVSSPNPAFARFEGGAGSLPPGISVRGDNGKKVIAAFDGSIPGQPSCSQLHGHAALDNAHLFGCAAAEGASTGGVFVLRRKSGKWLGSSRAYPDARRVSTLRTNDHARYVIGNFGNSGNYSSLIRIDPRSAGPLQHSDVFPIPGDQPVCQFAPIGERVVNLTADGTFRVYRVAPEWKEIASLEAVGAFNCAFDAKETRPSLAVLREQAFVSDPANKRIREFDLKTLKQGLDLPLDGVPGNLATSD
jgi:hypothetical protein